MAKKITNMGLDQDLYNEIEKQRGDRPRATYINEKLRAIVMPADLPKQADITASPQPAKEVTPANAR